MTYAKPSAPIAALLTPYDAEDCLDRDALAANAKFVVSQGAAGVCVNGATGENPSTTKQTKRQILETVRQAVGKSWVVAAIGAAQLADSVALARDALESGADLLLLPPPCFFSYSQDDIEHFYAEAARLIDSSVLIYNLPAFTNPIEKDRVIRLIETVPNIVGIKDSSGTIETLELVTATAAADRLRMVGSDSVFAEALRHGCCDGVISGVAGVLPEVIVGLREAHRSGDQEWFDGCSKRLEEFIGKVKHFPVPWALKIVAEARGWFPARFALPLTTRRQAQKDEMQQWFQRWWSEARLWRLMPTAASMPRPPWSTLKPSGAMG
ncbi:MAG: dihydrodipicolinate synthase family protein [Acidobacteria bacterium]|nr:dihydrodipicolinate synthase family protein [Acidobacteriota bacterium]